MMHDACSTDAMTCIVGGVVPPIAVERFRFPAIPSSPDSPAGADAQNVVWPECIEVAKTSACARMADGVLRQLMGGDAVMPCSLPAPKVVALTSPGPADGKTDLLLTLAPLLAQRVLGGVLVIDANDDHPDLTARLHIPPLQSAGQQPLIYPTNFPQLNVLLATSHASPRDLDRSWIEEFRASWPLTLLDMAPLAVPGTAELACCCDGVYLAVRLGHSTRRSLARAARAIHRGGGHLCGCLVVG